MIQIIKKDYKNLEEAVDNINIISIKYDYFKDYSIISNLNESTYTALLKFDVPKNYECFSSLTLLK